MSRNPKGKHELIHPDHLILHPDLQVRVRPATDDRVEVLAAAIKEKHNVARVEVRRVEGRGDFVTDGWTRTRAHRLIGSKGVPCNVRPGTWEDALADALAANWGHHGLPLTREDKVNAVAKVLQMHPRASNGKVVELLNNQVGEHFVRDARKLLQPDAPAERECSDGRTMQVPPGKRKGPDGPPTGGGVNVAYQPAKVMGTLTGLREMVEHWMPKALPEAASRADHRAAVLQLQSLENTLARLNHWFAEHRK